MNVVPYSRHDLRKRRANDHIGLVHILDDHDRHALALLLLALNLVHEYATQRDHGYLLLI